MTRNNFTVIDLYHIYTYVDYLNVMRAIVTHLTILAVSPAPFGTFSRRASVYRELLKVFKTVVSHSRTHMVH